MLKRILLLLDDTPASLVARRYATDLAKAMDAEVAGFAGVDLVSIETPMAGGVGTSAYKFQLEEQLKKQAEDIRNQQHDTYEQECKAQGLTFEWFAFEGDPVGSLNLAAETCDLIITGHDTGFQGNAHERFAEALAKMLMMTPRPMLVCGDELSAAQSVLVAYDGSLPAMRALQMFTLLGLGRGQTIHLTSIDADKEFAARRINGACRYLRSHGYEVEASSIATRVDPAEVLRIEAADRNIGTLVMGAYGRRGFRKFLFGSTTGALAEDPPCALFVYH